MTHAHHGAHPTTEAVRGEARARLHREKSELSHLLSRARRHLAAHSHGLSEEIEALQHHLSRVRNKVDRIQAARANDVSDLEAELEEGWTRLEVCAARIRAALDDPHG